MAAGAEGGGWRMAGHVHVLPVPRGMTPAEAWQEICDRGSLNVPDPDCRWAVLRCDGRECQHIETA